MILHPAISDIADRRRTIDKALREGSLSNESLREHFAFVYKEGTLPILGMGRSGSANISDATDDYIPFTISVLSEDRDGDVVIPLGCHLENYARNPVVFFGHQEWEIPIGVSRSSDGRICVFLEETRIRAYFFPDKADEDAMFIDGKVRRGILNASSIAFVPIEAYRRDDLNKAHRGGGNDLPKGWVFKQHDLTEWSIVGVPSNAGAIRDALDTEKSFITPRLQKGLATYAAQAKGCWNGWCPTCVEPSAPVAKQAKSEQPVQKYITHTGSKWVVHAESGKVLGTHDTKEDAENQLRAVEANKAKPKSISTGLKSYLGTQMKQYDEGYTVGNSTEVGNNPYNSSTQEGKAWLKGYVDAKKGKCGCKSCKESKPCPCKGKTKAAGDVKEYEGRWEVRRIGSTPPKRFGLWDTKFNRWRVEGEKFKTEAEAAAALSNLLHNLTSAARVVEEGRTKATATQSAPLKDGTYIEHIDVGNRSAAPGFYIVWGGYANDEEMWDGPYKSEQQARNAIANSHRSRKDLNTNSGTAGGYTVGKAEPCPFCNDAQCDGNCAEPHTQERPMAKSRKKAEKPVEQEMLPEEMETKDELLPKHSAQVIASLCKHAQAETDYLQDEMTKMDNPVAQAALEKYHSKMVEPRLEHLKGMFAEHHPDADLEKCMKGLEDDGGSNDTPTGENNMVDRGQIPEEKGFHDDDDEVGGPSTGDIRMRETDVRRMYVVSGKNKGEDVAELLTLGQIRQAVAIPSYEGYRRKIEALVGGEVKIRFGKSLTKNLDEEDEKDLDLVDWAQQEEEEAEHKSDGDTWTGDNEEVDTQEILERYQHPKSGKWFTRKATVESIAKALQSGGTIRYTSDGRAFLVKGVAKGSTRKGDPNQGKPSDEFKSEGEKCPKCGKVHPREEWGTATTPHINPNDRGPTKSNTSEEAAQFMKDMAEDEAIPGKCKAGLEETADELKSIDEENMKGDDEDMLLKAADMAEEMAEEEEIPKRFKAGFRHHAKKLRTLAKSIPEDDKDETKGLDGDEEKEGVEEEKAVPDDNGELKEVDDDTEIPKGKKGCARLLSNEVEVRFNRLKKAFAQTTGIVLNN